MDANVKTIRMRKEDHLKWDAALRSGEYKQASFTLYDPAKDGYCCLGVLQHCLTGEIEKDGSWPQNLPTVPWLKKHNIRFDGGFGVTVLPQLLHQGVWKTASHLNDTCQLSFEEIADLIKNHVEYVE